MKYRTDPKTGKQLSVLGFGLMRLPRTRGSIDVNRAEAMILKAAEQGVNYFDTAYVYGGSEEAFGKVLGRNSGLRERINIATKLPHQRCKAYDDLDRIFAEQLERLQVSKIDYYLIHNLPDPTMWQRLTELGIERWIAAKKAAEQIGQVGFSFHGKQNDFLNVLDAYDWDFCQIQYNYLDENYQAGRVGLEAAHAKGLPVIIMEPLRGGKLAGSLPKKATEAFKAADPDASTASWGLKWIYNQPEATVVLSGMNSEEQLSDNIATASSSEADMLGTDEHALYDAVISVIQGSYRVPCTGCNYCMPCPHGVNIPGCFSAYNARAFQGLATGLMQYATSTGINHKDRYSGARRCAECGACLKKCPQDIAIIDALKEVRRHMEPFWFGAVMAVARRIMT